MFPFTHVGCDLPATAKIPKYMFANIGRERVRAHQQQQWHIYLYSFPNSAETGGEQSHCSGQLGLPVEQTKAGQSRTEANARLEPIFMQSNGNRGQPIQTASLQTSELSEKLFLFVFLSPFQIAIFLFCPFLPLVSFNSSLYESGEFIGLGRNKAPQKPKRVGGCQPHLIYPPLLYSKPRWQGIKLDLHIITSLQGHISNV